LSTYDPGDPVYAREGDYEGQIGYVVSVHDKTKTNRILFTDEEGHGVFDNLTDDQLNPVEIENDGSQEFEAPSFGMGVNEFGAHLQHILSRSFDKVTVTGPQQAFFGFQEFEGKEPVEVLRELVNKLEDGMALLTQTHILVSRIGLALQAGAEE
jgi:hypothetical protein